ncbi:MAG: hypothetical protein ABL952_12865 [Pyrinomonadaceae bacterium]
MSIKIFKCIGGEVVVPNNESVLVDAQDGGNLVIQPPRPVWERGELNHLELTNWAFLVAATGRAMLETLPQLENGCINYWEAGNWALNEQAYPTGVFKTAKEYRKVHLHLLGRNPKSTNPDLKWGEAPRFPDFNNRFAWAKNNERLTAEDCLEIVRYVKTCLTENYGFRTNEIEEFLLCQICGYPIVGSCAECHQN